MSAPGTQGLNLSALVLALVGGLIAGISLVGYPIGSYVLIALSPNLQGMSPVTAIGILGLAVSLAASARGLVALSRTGAVLSGVLATLALINHALNHADTISPAIVRVLFDLPPERAGRISIATGLSVLLLAISFMCQRYWRLPADICAATGMVVASTALIGYATSAADLYSLPMFSTMALNTATAVFVLSVGALIVEPAVPSGSRRITRRGAIQIAIIVLIAALTDWLLFSTTATSPFGDLVIAIVVMLNGLLPVSLMLLRDARLMSAEWNEKKKTFGGYGR